MSKKITAGVIGATGYTGAELLRLLSSHPDVQLVCATSDDKQGQAIADVLPEFSGLLDMCFVAHDSPLLARCAVLFFATPTAVAMRYAPAYLTQGIKVIDLSADFRIKDTQVWQFWYGQAHTAPAELEQAVYGLPEIYRSQIQQADLVANPGCYPTAVILGLLPLLQAGAIDIDRVIADAKSGISGAGKQAGESYQFCELAGSFMAYAATGHRHAPEMRQVLDEVAGRQLGLVFAPHLVPMARGIHATLYAELTDLNLDVQALYAEHYQAEPFVEVLPAGSYPQTRHVCGSNICRLAIHKQGQQLIVLSVLDNLLKGAAGQAVQNMNLMFGINEQTGLSSHIVLP